tara:strand:- start:833 stop:1333 length:501 start_codon:yes stop_codon:yes gene_type:complete
MVKIIATGPESSGKTTLCKAISKHFKIPFNKEYAREYLNKLTDRNYVQQDLLKIAKWQLKAEKRIQLLDTDLITIKIWSEYKYGNCNNWILEEIEKQKKDSRLYFLCKPDIEWISDPLRENPKNRMTLFKLYKKELDNSDHNYTVIEGKNRALKAIKKITQERLLI